MNNRKTRRGRGPKSSETDTEHKMGGTFAVAAECTVADAGTLKSDLGKLLDDEGIVTLDISAVQRIDTAGMQVIVTFIRERDSQGRPVQWRGEAPAVTAAARLLGLTSVLKLPAAAQAAETAP